jgi:hypothetical protein
LYYRLVVTSLSGRVVYSETVLLKKPISTSSFTVSTVATNAISIMASGNFIYQLHDISGNKLAAGTGTGGFNTISIQNKPAGIYILSLSGCGEIKREKVLKL